MAACKLRRSGSVGQSALELMVSFMFLLMTFAIVILIAVDKTGESNEIKMFLDAKRIGESLKDNINTVSGQGSGYYRYFSIPEHIRGHYDYNVSVIGNTLYLYWDHRLSPYSIQLATSDVSIINLKQGLDGENCVINDGGAVKIKRFCGKISILVFEGSQSRDGTILSNISGACGLHVVNTSDVTDINLGNLMDYDALWLGYKSIASGTYILTADEETAIMDYVNGGGIVIASSQNQGTFEDGFLPVAIEMNYSTDVMVNATNEGESLFSFPNSINPGDLVVEGSYKNWGGGYEILAIKEGEPGVAHVVRLDHGWGTYLLTSLDVRDSMPGYDGNNTAIFMNGFNYLSRNSKC
ncbi:hypothetical protein ACFLRF_04060 [Candidatus Altiarchaeota archaeon]